MYISEVYLLFVARFHHIMNVSWSHGHNFKNIFHIFPHIFCLGLQIVFGTSDNSTFNLPNYVLVSLYYYLHPQEQLDEENT